ncbi:MAG: alpha/beta hydrolase [Actinomycetota bacterium]
MKSRSIAFTPGSLSMQGELVLPDQEPTKLAILCHGLPVAGPRDPSDPGYAGFARTIAAEGIATFWFDFRGTRGSPGDFSMQGWVDDLHAALDALDRLEREPLRKVLVGSSAGGAICIAAGAERSDVEAIATLAAPATWGLVEESPDALIARFKNGGMIREPSFPRDPQAWWGEWKTYEAEQYVSRVSPKPLLIVHGESDDVVPYLHAERLYAKARAPKELARIPNAGHQLRKDSRAVECLIDWLQRIS